MKRKIYLIASLMILLVYGCGESKSEKEYLEWESQQQVNYIYENVEALVRNIDIRYDAIHDYYEWSISIYCMPPYDLDYAEISSGNNQFNPPNFVDKTTGDTIIVEVCNKYINNNLIERYITQIK